jgi:hypothetical protein
MMAGVTHKTKICPFEKMGVCRAQFLNKSYYLEQVVEER